ncbi:ribbon-helix-helix domain-containing protein [Oceaniovalibus guishaninsula]|uniref:ribbon-helix-helix domain-containing protein n=1 Tax=Oceaniovalibus guishaninsula TaxID=1046117 RepID=UPI0009FFC8F1|nr:ribbon-helix-helix domain-containing protein [Oceaniovalibus guishaninsula]
MTTGRPRKHSLTLRGHRTSVTLEDAFWTAFRRIAAARNRPLNDLAAEIDAARGDVGLASALRVFILGEVAAGALSPAAPDRETSPAASRKTR